MPPPDSSWEVSSGLDALRGATEVLNEPTLEKDVRENRANGAENAEPPVGFEPTTARLRIESSTTELRWRGYVATTYRIGREVYAVVPMVVPKPAQRSASNRVPNLVVCCSTRYSTASARWRTWSKCPHTFRTNRLSPVPSTPSLEPL